MLTLLSCLLPLRKGIHKRQHDPRLTKAIRPARKRIETTFSEIAAMLPRRLHAVTPEGFESKIMAIFVAFAILSAQNEKMADERRVSKLIIDEENSLLFRYN
jgi:hypothetical protein